MTRLRRLALGTAVATYLLIVVGAIVRTTGSGLGCPDWPLCYGQLLPPPDPKAIIEWTHRFLGAIVSPLILATVAGSWTWGRASRSILVTATLIPLMLAIQIGLGAWVVWLETPALPVMVHLTFAMIILGMIVWIAALAGPAGSAGVPTAQVRAGRPRSDADAAHFARLVAVTTTATFLLVLIGAYVRASGAGWVCAGFPACNDQALPFGMHPLIDLHLTHRLAAYLVAALVFATAWQARRLFPDVPRIRRIATALAGLVLVQIAIGAVAVTAGPGWIVQSAHVAGAAAVWAMAISLAGATYAGVGERRGSSPTPDPRPPTPSRIAAYVQLTKPRVMVLLLITTLAAMLMAERGLPSLGLIFWTLLGGALATGGAGAINHYLDRDVDALMGRTAARPIPAGLVPARHALYLGVGLGVASFVLMAVFVNLLSAVLTLLALLFYVFVYTCWLKRTTPLNIVIGGAAGAVPPVVGIAAVTNEVSPLALFLFAIIFVWTPPHFWALALLMRRQYEAAGVPMLPIVRGEHETRRQIFWYTLAMVALTVLVVSVGLLGAVYLVAALVLGGLFIYYAVRLLRDANAAAAQRLFRYSIVYLALLFAAMVVDRQTLG